MKLAAVLTQPIYVKWRQNLLFFIKYHLFYVIVKIHILKTRCAIFKIYSLKYNEGKSIAIKKTKIEKHHPRKSCDALKIGKMMKK